MSAPHSCSNFSLLPLPLSTASLEAFPQSSPSPEGRPSSPLECGAGRALHQPRHRQVRSRELQLPGELLFSLKLG